MKFTFSSPDLNQFFLLIKKIKDAKGVKIKIAEIVKIKLLFNNIIKTPINIMSSINRFKTL